MPSRVVLSGQIPTVLARLTPLGRLPAANQLSPAIGLPLRNQAALGELLEQLYEPQSTDFHKFLDAGGIHCPIRADRTRLTPFTKTSYHL